MTDALGNLVRFSLGNLVRFSSLPGQRHDSVGVAPLIDGVASEGFIADKAFETDPMIAGLTARGAKTVLSQMASRKAPLTIDLEIDKWRHLVENFFCKPKAFSCITMRCDKTDASFEAMI